MKLVTVAVPVEVIQPGAVTQEQDVRFSAKILTGMKILPEYWLDAKRPEKSAAHALGMDGFRAGRGAEISHFSVHIKRADQMS